MATYTAVPQSKFPQFAATDVRARIRADIRPRSDIQLTAQDHAEIVENARLVQWQRQIVLDRTGNLLQVAKPSSFEVVWIPRDIEVRKCLNVARRDRSRRNITLCAAPSWTGEPRPDAKTVVLRSAPRLESYFGRELDFNDVSTYGTEHQPARRSGQGIVIADEALVSNFIRSHKTGKALLRYENGEVYVSQLCLILTYGKSIPDAIAALATAGIAVTEAALTKQAQRLRRALEREEAQWSRRLVLKLADEAPTGTAEYLRRVAKRRVPTFKNLSKKS